MIIPHIFGSLVALEVTLKKAGFDVGRRHSVIFEGDGVFWEVEHKTKDHGFMLNLRKDFKNLDLDYIHIGFYFHSGKGDYVLRAFGKFFDLKDTSYDFNSVREFLKKVYKSKGLRF